MLREWTTLEPAGLKIERLGLSETAVCAHVVWMMVLMSLKAKKPLKSGA